MSRASPATTKRTPNAICAHELAGVEPRAYTSIPMPIAMATKPIRMRPTKNQAALVITER